MDPVTIGTLLSGAGSVLGFLGGRKKKQQSVNLKLLRDNALAAGFNPAFALSATGGRGFETTPGLSSLEALGGAIGGVGEMFEALDPIRRETREAELELLREQIATYREQRELNERLGGGLKTAPKADTTGGAKPEVWQPSPVDPDNYYQEGGPWRGKYVYPIAGKLHVWDTDYSAPIEAIEGISGEVPSELAAVYAFITGASSSALPTPKRNPRRPKVKTPRLGTAGEGAFERTPRRNPAPQPGWMDEMFK